MNAELRRAVEKSQAAIQEPHAQARGMFKALVLTNPNYFGNLVESPYTPELPIVGNTFYESLGCVGYQPQQERLEAVVYVNQPSGYGSGICGAGTPEYVRFYLSFDNGATWQDKGLTSFQAYNIPEGTEGGKRLEYAVSLAVDNASKLCKANLLVRVRAILSWNNPPPPGQPNWQPVWGNVREDTIFLEPIRLIAPFDLFELAGVAPAPELLELIDPEAQLATTVTTLSAHELAVQYRDKGVPMHRFAFKELSAYVSGKSNLSAEAFTQLLPGQVLDPKLIDLLFPKTDGDTSFEELRCIGLDPNAPDTLVGIIHLKKASGFSGGPCTQGSREYVTFWGDFDGNGSFETCLGTASVQVYDLANLPSTGVSVAVRLPVDLSQYRQACTKGPRVVPIRAILSWNAPAACANPNLVPTWGNREETLINIPPGAGVPAGKIAILGGIPVSLIDNATGLTKPDAVFATNNLPPDDPDHNPATPGRPCPFGGRVTVQGLPLPGDTYRVEVMPVGGSVPTTVVTNLTLTRADGTVWVHTAAAGQFTYVPFEQNINGVLAQWDSAGDELWHVTLLTYSGAALVGIDSHLIQLDNTNPTASIEITSGPGSCGKFNVGDKIKGKYVARDKYLSGYGLWVEPTNVVPAPNAVNPASGAVNTPLPPGADWELDTSGMKPCGYIVRVSVSDRAIINSQWTGHHVSDSAGFCLESPMM